MIKEELYNFDIENEFVAKFNSGLNDAFFNICRNIVDEDCFGTPILKDWYKAACSLNSKGVHLCTSAIAIEAQKIGSMFSLSDFVNLDEDVSASGTDLEVLAVYLADLKRRRELFAVCHSIANNVLDDSIPIEVIARDLRKASEINATNDSSYVSIRETGNDLLGNCQNIMNGTFATGFPCGFKYIDRKGGLMPSDLNIIAGTTSMGKTSLALAMALGAASRGTPTVLYSLEMSLRQLTARISSIDSGIASSKMLTRPLEIEEYDRLCGSVAKLSQYPIYFDKKCNTNYDMIERSIRSLSSSLGIKLAIVDYAQLITGGGGEKRDRIANAANNLKSLARELDICIILVSQLARVSDNGTPVPRLSRLKESGDLENAADNVYLVYRPEWFVGRNYRYPDMTSQWSKYSTCGTGLLIQAKGRNNGLGECLLGFDGKNTRYFDIDPENYIMSDNSFSVQPNNKMPF